MAARLDQPFAAGTWDTPAGPVPRVEAALRPADHRGALLVRLRIRRNEYKVDPGLYALGAPSPTSPVLVTASYKLSFDTLRAALPGLDAWILVLDTAGINVWCAAGKGTFGTDELCARVEAARLAEVVSHRTLVLPQLGASGVTAHQVPPRTGFRVRWGPVEAADLPAFLAADGRAEAAMRVKRFPLRERAVLIPVEGVGALRYAGPAVAALVLAAALTPAPWATRAGIAAAAVTAGLVGGLVLAPLGLPWLPGRAFALKGLWAGLGAALLPVALAWGRLGPAGLLGGLCLCAAIASFLALNFTGCSTFTSLSGVRRELHVSIPFIVAGAVVGVFGLLVG